MGKTIAEQECAHVVKHGKRLLLLGIPPKLIFFFSSCEKVRFPSSPKSGRSAQDTFLAEYMTAVASSASWTVTDRVRDGSCAYEAPKTARAATQADYSLHNLENYEILEAGT